jgi:hypothetical protein
MKWSHSPIRIASFLLPGCHRFMHHLQDWYCKGTSLAAACLRSDHHITSSQYQRDCLRLHRGGQPVTQQVPSALSA